MTSLVAVAAASFAFLSAATDVPAHRPGTGLPEVSLDMERCPSLPRDEVSRLAGLELEARVVPLSGGGGDAGTRVELACSGSSVQLRVSDASTGRQLLRSMQLGDREERVAPRLVAVAISELVITSWMDPAAAPSPTASGPRAGPPASDSGSTRSPPGVAATGATDGSTAAATAQERRESPAEEPAAIENQAARVQRQTAPAGGRAAAAQVLLIGQATGPWPGVGLGWGGGLRVGWHSGDPWFGGESGDLHPGFELDLAASWAEASSPLGNVNMSIWSAAPRASVRFKRGWWWMNVGVGGRVGLARLVGTPRDPATARGATLAGTWGGPAAHGGLGLQWRHLVLAVGLETGYVVRTVSGRLDGVDAFTISGTWLALTVAMGWGT